MDDDTKALIKFMLLVSLGCGISFFMFGYHLGADETQMMKFGFGGVSVVMICGLPYIVCFELWLRVLRILGRFFALGSLYFGNHDIFK